MSAHGRFIAGDAKTDGRFEYARQLQRVVHSPPVSGIDLSRRAASAIEDLVNGLADFPVADDDETPRLHQPDRRGVVRRVEEARKHLVRYLIRLKR